MKIFLIVAKDIFCNNEKTPDYYMNGRREAVGSDLFI